MDYLGAMCVDDFDALSGGEVECGAVAGGDGVEGWVCH